MTYISLVETGKRNPTITAVSAVLNALRVTWAEFGAEMDRNT
jgi:transcriptional regulator with XRE-family HTH domain